MTGKGHASNSARRSSCVASCSSCGMGQAVASRMPTGLFFLEFEFFVDHAFEGVEGLRAVQHASIDEKGWGTVDAGLLSRLHVRLDLGLVLVRIDARVELRGLESQPGRMLLQVRIRES